MTGPQFVRYFKHVIIALKALGNSGRPAEVREWIAQELKLSDDELNKTTNNGASRFESRVAWARFYLSKAGYIDSSKRGVWSLTEKGLQANLTDKEALEIFRQTHELFKGSSDGDEDTVAETAISESAPPESNLTASGDYRARFLEAVRGLSPTGFENLCKRLLRESGFQQVEVTGRTNDGGIDGKGILQINPLLSMQVIFQCKRYKANSSIGASLIRDFRGAMAGRTDKGIFITTSSFTAEAKREALREGVPPIELVDGDKLTAMFVELELGLIPKIVYEVDQKFFEEFV